MRIRKRRAAAGPLEPVAGNGLLDRRALLGRGIVFAGAMTTGSSLTGAAAEPLKDDPWSLEVGAVLPARQVPSRFERDTVAHSPIPIGSSAPRMRARRTTSCKARSRPTACSSRLPFRPCRISTRPSTSW